jgi:hypothetical protein
MVGPIRPLAQHDPLNGDRAMLGLCLKPGGPARNNPFLFHAMSGHAPEGTSPAGHGTGRASMARWLGIAPRASVFK